MSKYNFEPDFKKWLSKKNLLKEQLALLLLGVSPDDYYKYCRLSEEMTEPHTEWCLEFEKYYTHCDPFFSNNLAILLRDIKSDKKENFFQEAYDRAININLNLSDILIRKSLLKINQKVKIYKNHSLYRDELISSNLPSIQNSNQALAVLLGLEKNSFDRFMILSDKVDVRLDCDPRFLNADEMNTDDKWFFKEYSIFIRKHFKVDFSSNIAAFARDVKKYCVWDNEFYKFVQDVHNEGFVFSIHTYARLEKDGIVPSYVEGRWALKFYQNYLKRSPIWTIEEAGKLYMGVDPLGGREFNGFGDFPQGESGYGLHRYNQVLFFNENGGWDEPTLSNFSEETSLDEFLRKYQAMGIIKPIYENGKKIEFEPKEIIQFLKDYCPNTYQPKALFYALGISLDENSDKEIVRNTAVEHARKSNPEKISPEKERQDIESKILIYFSEYQKTHAKFPRKDIVVAFLKRKENGYSHMTEVSLLKKFTMKPLKEQWLRNKAL